MMQTLTNNWFQQTIQLTMEEAWEIARLCGMDRKDTLEHHARWVAYKAVTVATGYKVQFTGCDPSNDFYVDIGKWYTNRKWTFDHPVVWMHMYYKQQYPAEICTLISDYYGSEDTKVDGNCDWYYNGYKTEYTDVSNMGLAGVCASALQTLVCPIGILWCWGCNCDDDAENSACSNWCWCGEGNKKQRKRCREVHFLTNQYNNSWINRANSYRSLPTEINPKHKSH